LTVENRYDVSQLTAFACILIFLIFLVQHCVPSSEKRMAERLAAAGVPVEYDYKHGLRILPKPAP
jgi:hypothetical protein